MQFYKVSKYLNDEGISLPVRKTIESAGYDFASATDIVIPSYLKQMKQLEEKEIGMVTLTGMQNAIKQTGIKPTLIPTGIKCEITPGWFLQLSVRSSCPLKSWIVLANGVGIIDGDYYNNPSNEGEIFFQVINLTPYDILVQKGDTIGQGVFMPYGKIWNDKTADARVGGFGSTDG